MATADLEVGKQTAFCQTAIVDDEPGVRFLLARLFESAGLSCRSYETANDLLVDAEHCQFGCFIIDICLLGISGLELQAELRRRSPEASIVVMSGRATVADTIRAFTENAKAFFEKPFQTGELLEKVQQLILESDAKRAKRETIDSRLSALSSRERQVMDALIEGKKTIQIAHELKISPSTVEKHRLKVFEKTRSDSVIELIRLLG